MMNRGKVSRRARKGSSSRSFRRERLLVPAALALLVGVPAAVATLASNGIEVPGITSVKSLLSMIEERSPGERTTAELTKVKQKKLAEVAPRQRALGKIHQAEPPKEFVEALDKPSEDAIVPPMAAAEPLIAALAPPIGDGPVPPPAGGLVPGGGGGGGEGGGGGGGGGEVTPPPPPPPSAVPEPGTWAMMLVGFGSIGMMLRRRRRLDGRTLLPAS